MCCLGASSLYYQESYRCRGEGGALETRRLRSCSSSFVACAFRPLARGANRQRTSLSGSSTKWPKASSLERSTIVTPFPTEETMRLLLLLPWLAAGSFLGEDTLAVVVCAVSIAPFSSGRPWLTFTRSRFLGSLVGALSKRQVDSTTLR